MRAFRTPLGAALTLALFALTVAAADLPTKSKVSASPEAKLPSTRSVVEKLGALPLRFEPNHGQAGAHVKYMAHGPGYTLFLTKDEAVLTLVKPMADAKRNRHPADLGPAPPEYENSVVRMRIVGANPEPTITPDSPQPGTTNYFLGNDRNKWRTGIPGYGRVAYHTIYPGIDVVFYGNPQRLEYDFTAAPGADPARIQLAFDGADAIEKSAPGDLLLHCGSQVVTVHKPLVYQADKNKPIDAQFVLHADNRVGFALGAYDHSQPLTIDPVLTYSSYLGGSVSDIPLGIGLDAQGDIIVAGTTASPDFPVNNDSSLRGNSDIFVAKLEPLGRFLIFSSYVGGSGTDGTFSNFGSNMLAMDGSGNAYVAGLTQSHDFPTVGPVQANHGGGDNDAFVFELSPNGQTLLFSSYFGGTANDYAIGIALDAAGHIILGGNTDSTDFPLVGALQSQPGEAGLYTQTDGVNWNTINNGLTATDVWAIAVDPTNHATLYAGTNGGGVYKSTDTGAHWLQTNSGLAGLSVRTLAVDPVTPSNVYVGTVTGFSRSTNAGANWTTTLNRNIHSIVVNPASPSIVLVAANGGVWRSTDSGVTFTHVSGTSGTWFWLALDPSNSNRVLGAAATGVYVSTNAGNSWALTGSGLPTAQVIAVDPNNPNILYAGLNSQTNSDNGFYQSSDGGVTWPLHNLSGSNITDIRTSPTVPGTIYATRRNNAVLKSSNGGASWSSELTQAGFRGMAVVAGDPDILYAGTTAQDGWVAKLGAGGAGVLYSTLVAGNRSDSVLAVAADPAGNATVAGSTVSDQTLPIVNAFQAVIPSGNPCWVTKLNSAGSAYVFSTYLGGTVEDECFAAAADSAGDVYVTGSGSSPDFPLVNPAQPTFGGFFDLFITKFSPSGAVLYSTFWGGSGDEDGRGLFVDGSGNLFLTGDTGSTNFPTVNPSQPAAGFAPESGGENAVVLKLNPSGAVVFATYLGGSGVDNGNAVVANGTGDIYVAGLATSQDFPLAGHPFQSVDNTAGGGTSFISKIALFPPAVLLSSHALNFGPVTQNLTSPPQVVTLTNTGSGPLLIAHHPLSGPVNPGSPFFYTTNCGDVVAAGAMCSASFTLTPPGIGVFNDQLTITDDAPDSPQIITLTGTGVATFAAASVSPPALHFGNVGVNFTSPGQNVTITSTGTAPLLFNSITTSDPQFAISNNTCPGSLNPGLSCTVTVTVTPAETGEISGNLIISDNTVDSPQLVSLDANGTQSITVTQPLSPTNQNTFTFPGQTFTYGIQFPPGTNFSGVTAAVTAAFSTTADFQARVAGTFPGAQCIVYDGSGGSCTVFQIKCTPSPCPSSAQPNIIVKTAFDSSQPIINPGFLQAESGSNSWHNIFTEFLLPKIDGTIKGGTDGFSDFAAVNLPLPAGVQAGTFMSFLAPLAPKNGRVFSVGDTIPVKFQVAPVGANTSVFPYKGPFMTNATAKLALVQGTFERAVKLANNHGTAPNIFKYNSVLNAYEFYLDTTGLPAGQYQLTVFSNSFPAQQVTFTLQ